MTFSTPIDNQFDDESLELMLEGEFEGGGYPYIQVLTHPNENPVKVKKERPWGFFLNQENADAIGFQPDDNWKPCTFYTVEGESFANAVVSMTPEDIAEYGKAGQEVTEHTGYLSHNLMFHLILNSQVEVETKGEKSYRFVALRWHGDKAERQATEDLLKEVGEDGRKTHRWIQRYLIVIIGADGEPLHDGVIQWKAKGGAGGAFASELKEFNQNLNSAYGTGRGKSRLNLYDRKNQYGGDNRAFVRMEMGFDLYKENKDTAPYLVPVACSAPVGDPAISKAGKPVEVPRGRNGERKAKLHPSLLICLDAEGKMHSDMMVPRKSPMGEAIHSFIVDNEAFPTPYTGGDQDDTLIECDRPYSGSGFLNAASMVLNSQDGITYVSIVTDEGEVPLAIGAEHCDALDNPSLTVTGIMPADGGPVKVTGWESLIAAPVAAEQVGLLAEF